MGVKLEKTSVFLLAGGNSSRVGQPKGLIEVQGRPFIETQIASLKACGLGQIVVVLGYHAEAYASVLGPDAASKGVVLVTNPSPQFGQFSSIQAAGRMVADVDVSEAIWILPIDVPCPLETTWKKLSASSATVCIPVSSGRGGHPVRVSMAFLKGLLALPPEGKDSRLDFQIKLLAASEVERLEVGDPSILRNLNTTEDWDSFRGRKL